MITDDTEVEVEESEDEGYEPYPHNIMDGEVAIFDPIEFSELTNSVAAVMRDGGLFVLDRATFKWRNVETAPKPSTLRELNPRKG